MNKTSKIVILIVALICVIGIVIFFVTRAPGDDDAGTTDTPGITDTGTDQPTDSVEPTDTTTPTDPVEPTDTAEETPTPLPKDEVGTPHELDLPQEKKLAFNINDEVYTAWDEEDTETFYESSVMDMSSYLEISFIEGEPAIVARSFLDRHLSYDVLNSMGDQYMASTEIHGESVSATDGTQTIEAWIIDMEVCSVGIAISYKTDEQRTAYYNILNTMEIIEPAE